MRQLRIVILAGVQTRPSFFISLVDRLEHFLFHRDILTTLQIEYPYGDDKRGLWKQVLDLCVDINMPFSCLGIGGYRLRPLLEKTFNEEQIDYLFIGHSGGGIAAYRLATYMYNRRQVPLERLRVIQIGSPRMKISRCFKGNTIYIRAVYERGKRQDPITKLGSWGGMRLSAQWPFIWDTNKHSPYHVYNTPIIGGHADYFRVSTNYINHNAQSNLDLTFMTIAKVLDDWI